MATKDKNILYTIGHSNRTIEYFLSLLEAYGIKTVVDVRTIPKSRHNPQFNQDDLKKALKSKKIGYIHLKKLGGLRHSKKDSANTGWNNLSFRGFADYMQTKDFEDGLKKLKSAAQKQKTAIMCAEAVPWRCHRSLIADAMTKLPLIKGFNKAGKKWQVFHIQSRKTAQKHQLTPFFKIKAGKIIYPKK